MSYSRPISLNERLYLACRKLFPPFCIQVVIDADGPIDVNQLRLGLEKASDAHPGARAVLRRQGRHYTWTETERPVELKIISETESALFRRPLDPVKGPTVEVLYAERSKRLVFRGFHGVVDAAGLLFFAAEVMRGANGRPLSPTSDGENEDHWHAKLQAPKFKVDYSSYSSWPSGGALGPGSGFAWRQSFVPGVHPGVVAKFAAFLYDYGKEESPRLRLMLPLNLRPYLGTVKTTANMGHATFLEMRRPAPPAQIQAELDTLLARGPQILSNRFGGVSRRMPMRVLGRLLKSVTELQQRRNRYLYNAVFHDLGTIPLNDFSCGGFRARGVRVLPLDLPGTPLTVFALQHELGLEMTWSMPERVAVRGKLDEMISRFCDFLEKTPGKI